MFAGSKATASAAVEIQRTWRGVRARRAFSELFFDAVSAFLGQEELPPPLPWTDEDVDEPHTPPRRKSLSLEEAAAEASYNPSAGCFVHVASHHPPPPPPPSSQHRRTLSCTPGSSTPLVARCLQRWASSSAAVCGGGTPGHSRSGSGSGPVVADTHHADGGGHGGHSRSGSGGAAPAFGGAAASSVTSHSRCTGGEWCGSSAHHRRTKSESLHRRTISEGVHTAAAIAAQTATDVGAPSDLEFTEEMAESMSIDALRELAGVLTRIIATRNNDLITLQLRRDELRHERNYRQATVKALVAQVDRSQYVREERRKAGKQGRAKRLDL